MPIMVRLLLFSLAPINSSPMMKSADGGCSGVGADSLNHVISGLGLPVARQEKVAF